MDKNEIIKAIEAHRKGECHNCPYEALPRCFDILCENTVKFIGELTEENERLKGERDVRDTLNKDLMFKNEDLQKANKDLGEYCIELQDELNTCIDIKADTIKKTLDAIRSRATRNAYSCMISGDIRETYTISGKALEEIEKNYWRAYE